MNNEKIEVSKKDADKIALEVAIGYEVSQLLSLKFSKAEGRTKTAWGTKSVQGLGACIARIVQEQTERLKD